LSPLLLATADEAIEWPRCRPARVTERSSCDIRSHIADRGGAVVPQKSRSGRLWPIMRHIVSVYRLIRRRAEPNVR